MAKKKRVPSHTTPPARDERDKDLIYGVLKMPKHPHMEDYPDYLVFIPRKMATDLASDWEALHTATTWGEFRAKMPPEEYEAYMARSFDEDNAPRPNDETQFTPTEEGWSTGPEGYWPDNPMYWMYTFVPKAVWALRSGGTDPYIWVTEEVEALRILHQEGYRVERNDELTKAACGEYLESGS
jgi:hypothetical protein